MSRFYFTTSFTTSFEFPLLSNSYMESTNIEGLQDKQNSKNTGGIMRYQLRNFQLFLVVFLTGSSGNVFPYRDKFDPIWNGIKYRCKIKEISVGIFNWL